MDGEDIRIQEDIASGKISGPTVALHPSFWLDISGSVTFSAISPQTWGPSLSLTVSWGFPPTASLLLPLPSPSSSALSQFLLAPCWPWTSSENSWTFPLYLWWAIELGIPRLVPNLLPRTNGAALSPRASSVSHQEWVGGVSLHVNGLRAPDVGFIRVCYKILREPLVGLRGGAGGWGVNTNYRRRHSTRLSHLKAQNNQLLLPYTNPPKGQKELESHSIS